MHFETSWHAEGLRWIASLFLDAANFLERTAARPCEPGHAAPAPADDFIDAVRTRIHSRYF